ncbi:MFS transporter [Bartonella rattaustraliani]|uniref:MFS transporter n=1 Tax=Bartonella rattaustraliani TaxID=481139 RepID=UPI0002E27C02|nr:MFS transporter [Bartonella rattaustraliani]
MLLVGLVIFGVASLLVGLSSVFPYLVFFRFLQGIGCAILYTVSGAIITYMFKTQEQGKALGILFAVNGIGLAIGPVLGGGFAALISWRYAFLINIPFLLLSLFLCIFFVPEGKSEDLKKIDIKGCFLLTITLLCGVSYFSLQLTTAQEFLLLSISLISAILFFIHEIRFSEPMIEFHFFKNPLFIAALLASFFFSFFLFVFTPYSSYCIIKNHKSNRSKNWFYAFACNANVCY